MPTLSDALHDHEGASSVTAAGDGDLLIVFSHEDTWRVAFRLTPPGNGRGPWRMSEFASLYVGSGFVTSEDLRRLPIGTLLGQARELARASVRPTAGPFHKPSDLSLSGFREDGRGRGKRTDRDFAELAQEYTFLVEDGDRSPAKTLSERIGSGSPAVWANRISEARQRGLLSEVSPGKSGGGLTAKAHELLFGSDPADE